jgi:hypothetical protein
MFGFASRRDRDPANPLQSSRVAADWLRGLAVQDVTGRQAQVIGALADWSDVARTVGREDVGALLAVDSALAADHDALLRRYFDNRLRSPTVSAHFLQIARERNRSLIGAYRKAAVAAFDRFPDAPWKLLLPRLAARLVDLHGIDLKLGLFGGESAMGPQLWRELHALFLRTVELGLERTPAVLPGDDPLARHPMIEHEYVHVLLLDLLRTGNLDASDIDWAATQIHGWTRDLALLPQPAAEHGFYVDFALNQGLARRSDTPIRGIVGYLDTTPLVLALDSALADLRESGTDPGARPAAGSPSRARRIAALEKIRPALAPLRTADLRRHPRVAVDVMADVCFGLANVIHRLAHVSTAAANVPPSSVAEEPPCPMAATEAPAPTAAADVPPASAAEDAAPPTTVEPPTLPSTPLDVPLEFEPALAATADAPPAQPTPLPWPAIDVEEIELSSIGRDEEWEEALVGLPDESTRRLAANLASRLVVHPARRKPARRTPAIAASSTRLAAAPTPDATPGATSAPHWWWIDDRSAAGLRISTLADTGAAPALGALVAVLPSDTGEWELGVVRRLTREAGHETALGLALIGRQVAPVALHGLRTVRSDMSVIVDGFDASAVGPRFEGIYVSPLEELADTIEGGTLVIPTAEHVEGRRLLLTTARADYTVTLGHAFEAQAEWSWVAAAIAAKLPREE